MGYSVPIKGGIISMCNVEFQCPHCTKRYVDHEDKYLQRCNRNKSFCTTIKCECKRKFGVTFDIKGDIVSFELNVKHPHSQS